MVFENHSGRATRPRKKSVMISLSLSIQYRRVTDRHATTAIAALTHSVARIKRNGYSMLSNYMGLSRTVSEIDGDFSRKSQIAKNSELLFNFGLFRLRESGTATFGISSATSNHLSKLIILNNKLLRIL